MFDQPVYEMLRVGTSLYVVGQFTKVNGIARKGVVKLTLPEPDRRPDVRRRPP